MNYTKQQNSSGFDRIMVNLPKKQKFNYKWKLVPSFRALQRMKKNYKKYYNGEQNVSTSIFA